MKVLWPVKHKEDCNSSHMVLSNLMKDATSIKIEENTTANAYTQLLFLHCRNT